jgi:hypothetical protein
MRPQVEQTIKKVFAAAGVVALLYVAGRILGGSSAWNWIVLLLVIAFAAQQLLLLGGMIYLAVKNRRPREPEMASRAVRRPKATKAGAISVLRVAIDARARGLVEKCLPQFEASPSTLRRQEVALREVAVALLRLQRAWTHVGLTTDLPKKRAIATELFEAHAEDSRHDVISEVSAGGVILVSVIACAKYPVLDVQTVTGETVRRALERVTYGDKGLFALHVVRKPGEGGYSASNLVARYPTLTPVTTTATTYCHECSAPSGAELASCPDCGSPAAHPA